MQTILLIAIPDYDAVMYQDISDIHLDSRVIQKYQKEAQSSQYTIDPHCCLSLVRRTNHSVLGLTPMVSVVVVMVLVVNHG